MVVVTNTGLTKPDIKLVLDNELALRLGLVPGDEMHVHTAAGYVKLTTPLAFPPRRPSPL
jgi:hypothetical protein